METQYLPAERVDISRELAQRLQVFVDKLAVTLKPVAACQYRLPGPDAFDAEMAVLGGDESK